MTMSVLLLAAVANPLLFPSYDQEVVAEFADEAAAKAAECAIAPLPGDATMAFSCRWDDSNAHHLSKGEMMRRAGVKGTFYLTGGDWKSSFMRDGVKRLVGMGHAIGNHTGSHQFMLTISPNAAFREVAAQRIALEKLLQRTVTSYVSPFGWQQNPMDDAQAPTLARAIVASGHFVTQDNVQPWSGMDGKEWMWAYRFSADDRNPDRGKFVTGFNRMLAAARKDPVAPRVTLGTHSWCDAAGEARQEAWLKEFFHPQGAAQLNDWEYGAYRYQYLNGKVEKVGVKGRAATFRVRRFAAAFVGDEIPLSIKFTAAPAKVTSADGEVARADGGTWALRHSRGRGMTAEIAEGHDGVDFKVAVDEKAGELTVTLSNATGAALENAYVAAALPPKWATRRVAADCGAVANGATVTRKVKLGAIGRKDYAYGTACYPVALDFTLGGRPIRLWKLVETPEVRLPATAPAVATRVWGPGAAGVFSEVALVKASRPGAALPSGEAWRRLSGRGLWNLVATPVKLPLKAAGAARYFAYDFLAARDGTMRLATNLKAREANAVIYLNGARTGFGGPGMTLPVRQGMNRLILRADAVGGSYTQPLYFSLGSFAPAAPRSPRLPTVDLSAERSRQTVIAEGAANRYEGHPTTLLADDGRTMFCVWTTGHGGPCGQMARSDDGGRTWRRVDSLLPEVYARTHRNCPTLQKVKGPDGVTRYFIYSAKAKEGSGLGVMVSEDLGASWRELPCQPQLSAGMPPTGLMPLKDGTVALFGQVRKDPKVKTDRPADDQAVWMALSKDGGRTYGEMRVVMTAKDRNLCEPCCLRSPDGKSLVLLARENRHRGCSMMAFSDDEGKTWTAPVDTPWELTGDRHEGVLLPDGRYVVAFRDQAVGSATRGQFVAWVGTFDDLRKGRPGQCRIHLLRHFGLGSIFPGGSGDTGYSGVELLPDGTIVCTTYLRYFDDERQSSVASTRFRIDEIDARLRAAAKPDWARFVDPFTGTAGTGHTHPSAAYPFGMVQAGPDTGFGDWAYCPGYQFRDRSVLGYSLTHLSGTGCADYNDVQILPFTGEAGALPMRRAIDKQSEIATPGYYRVVQDEDGVEVEVTAARRAAIYRFTWARPGKAKVLLNLPFGQNAHRVWDARVAASDGCAVAGSYMRNGWIRDRRIAFAFAFDRKWTALEELPKKSADEPPRYIATFDVAAGERTLVKVGLSMTDADGARRNLAADIPGWDFEGARAAARNRWNDLFARSTCEGTDDQKANWYTALYHLYLQPNDYADADGRFCGADGKVARSPDGTYFTTLSLWDTFRAAQPWYTIATPEVVEPVIRSFLSHYRTFGRLPVMSYGGKNVDCMVGNHSVPVVADAYAKGFRDFDHALMFEAITNTLRVAHPGKPKENWDVYERHGYFPCDVIRGESVSRTLECSYDDWCAARYLKATGHDAEAAFFAKRAEAWKNVFDSSIGFGRGKTSAGKWRDPFDPFAFGHGAENNNDFTEGNAFQYSWHVMQDVPGLVAAMGGRDRFVERLDSLFTAQDKGPDTQGNTVLLDISGMIGQYVHGNEPSHHVIYFYPQVGCPEKAAERIREVFDTQYHVGPEGLCGNDDCGQMSAWYVFSAMGFYPFNPCGGEYVVGAPQVPKATLNLPNGKCFTMTAKGLSKANKYVRAATLNGKPLAGWALRHADVVAGGELVFEMAPRP